MLSKELLISVCKGTAQISKGLLFLCICLGCSVHAQEISVKLQSLESIKTQESVDELYLTITEFPASGSPHRYQIPTYPTHWLSKHLNTIRDIVVWRKDLKQCEPMDLLISLVEEDFAPWNMDDLLGSVQLRVKCVNGKATPEWSVPNTKNTVQVQNQKNTFSFVSPRSEYRVVFKLEDKSKPRKLTQKEINQEINQKQYNDFNIAPMF